VPWPGPTSTDTPAPLGIGTAPLGGLFEVVAEAEALAAVRRGIERGAVVVDTAPFYGSGLSESRVGAALAAVAPADRPLLSTKVGRVLVPGHDPGAGFVGNPDLRATFDWSESGIRRAFESSLGRLGVERVDVALAHDADAHEDEALATGFPAMRRLQEEGLVTAVGAGMNQAEMLERFVRKAGLDVILLAGRWTLLDHAEPARRLLDLCLAEGVGVMLGGVLNSGLLAGGSTFDYAPAPPELLARRDALAARCREHDVDLEHAAIRFCADHPAVSAVLVGVRDPAEVDAAADRIAAPVPPELWDDLRRHGLIDPATAHQGEGS
jgi:D-threo-aldose 1-dehydrogenase